MSRCRANSFYVAPGQYRSFDDWAMFTHVDGQWTRLTHRKDVERLSGDPCWDGRCYVVHRDYEDRVGERSMDPAELLRNRPEVVELWQLDARTVNGRRSGPAHHLHAVARHGTRRAGGTRDAVGVLLGPTSAGKATVAWFTANPMEPTAEAMALKLLAASTAVLDDSGMQALVAAMRRHQPYGPMPVFDTAAVGDLAFLLRYPPQRRVTLLADLWRDQVDGSFSDMVRVGAEVVRRRGAAADRARETIVQGLAADPARVARMLSGGDLWFQDIAGVLPREVVSMLAADPKHRHRVAFHMLNDDADVARSVLADERAMSNEECFVDGTGPMHSAVAAAVRDELPKIVRHTHSPNKSRTMLALAVKLAEQDPDAAHLVADAFAGWCRSKASVATYATDDIVFAFEGRDLRLDGLTCERLYKHQVEFARRNAAVHLDKEAADAQPVGARTGQDWWMSSSLMSVLETQRDAPAKVTDQARAFLTSKGATQRGSDGRLRGWREHLVAEPVGSQPVIEVMVSAAEAGADVVNALDQILAVAATFPLSDGDYAAVRDTYRLLCEPDQTYRVIRERTEMHIAAQLRTADRVRRAVTGTSTAEDLATLATNDREVLRALNEHAQTLPKASRAALLAETRDPDVAVVGFLLNDETDVLSADDRDGISRQVQLQTLLHERPEVKWPEKPKRWDDLPTSDFLPWDIAPLADRFDGDRVELDGEPFDIRVIRRIQDLRANAAPNCMGNCTVHYASDIRRGEALILAVGRDRRTEINVSVIRESDGAWAVDEVKGPRNTVLPPEMESALTAHLKAHISERRRPGRAVQRGDVNEPVF
jgi:hypothetical protein